MRQIIMPLLFHLMLSYLIVRGLMLPGAVSVNGQLYNINAGLTCVIPQYRQALYCALPRSFGELRPVTGMLPRLRPKR